MINPVDALTARVLMRVTASGTLSPLTVPQTRTHKTQVGRLYYRNLSDVMDNALFNWWRNAVKTEIVPNAPFQSGAELIGDVVLQACGLPCPDGVNLLTALGELEYWLAVPNNAHHNCAVHYVCGPMSPAHDKPLYPANVQLPPVLARALAHIASNTL